MHELGFNVPPTTRSYGDGFSAESLFQKTREAGDRSCDLWLGSLACYPLHHRHSSLSIFTGRRTGNEWLFDSQIFVKPQGLSLI